MAKQTAAQKRIIQRIRDLHRRGEALNLSAMKRNHPKLIEAVYSTVPYWGWKQALADAGVDYASIQIQLQDFVTCRICGEESAAICTHVVKHHKVPMAEYREEFPDAAVLSEEIRAERFKRHCRDKKGLPHWELFYTPEYILDRIYEHCKQGRSLHARGVVTYDAGLLGAARDAFGNWHTALEQVGLDPESIRRKPVTREWSQETIINELQRHAREGSPMNQSRLRELDTGLFQAIQQHFPGYDDALMAAGFNPKQIRQSPQPYDEEDYHRFVDELHRVAALDEGPQKRLQCRAFKKQYWGVMFSYFKTWRAACAHEEVTPRQIYVGPFYPDRQAVLNALVERLQHGLSVAPSAIGNTDRRLYHAARKYYGRAAKWTLAAKRAETRRRRA